MGPAADTKEILRELILNGMNVARLNFSHGSHEEHAARIQRIKEVRKELGIPVAIMLDTKGPRNPNRRSNRRESGTGCRRRSDPDDGYHFWG